MERDELILTLAKKLTALEAEKKAFQAEYAAAKAPIDKREAEDKAWELARNRWGEIHSQLVGLKPHFARECEKLMPPIWKTARRYCVEAADHAGADGPRREVFDAATAKLDKLFLVPGDLVQEVSAIRHEVGEKLSALEIARANEAVTTTAPAGLRKSRPVTAGQFAAAVGVHCFDDGVAAVIEAD